MKLVDVDALQSVRTYPCVSILLSTEPGPRPSPREVERLESLVATAVARLRLELEPGAVAAFERRLADLAAAVQSGPTLHGLALFASEDLEQHGTLVVPVRDRVVVDDTFATRDLVDHLHRSTPYWLLVVSERSARLFLGDATRLVAADGGRFPMEAAEDDRPEDFLRRVGAELDADPGPDSVLVVAGPERTLSSLLRATRCQPVGRVAGSFDRAPLGELHARSWPVMARALDARQSLALGELDRARDRRRLASGLAEVWSLAHDGRVDLVVVERGFEAPARVGDTIDDIAPADDRDAPGVVDDLVDDLIEVVLAKGGRAAFVADGILASSGRIAAALRY